MRDIPSWKQAPCVNSMEPITSSTAPLNSHELCYATSDNPTEGFEFGGVLVSNGDIGLPGITDVKKMQENVPETLTEA